jgi:xylulokinase
MSSLLSIDLGTSSAKAALFDVDSMRLIATADREYPILHPQPGYAEQDPDDWWQAVVAAVRDVLNGHHLHHILAIGLDGQMHGLVCLDSNLRLLHPAIIWADARASQEIKQLAKLRQKISATLPGPPASGFAAGSVLWINRHLPSLLERTRAAILPKDAIRLQLTGLLGTDPSDAAGTWLFDIKTGAWAPEVASFCGLRLDQLPPVIPSAHVAGELIEPAAKALGLPAGIPVVTGCADLPAQALGHGVVDPGVTLVTIGTGAQAISPLTALPPDPTEGLYIFQHAIPNRWYIQAAILSAGLSLRWLRDLLGLRAQAGAYDQLSTLAAAVPPGAEGLLFLPYLAGERTPYMDTNASGMLLGLRLHHQARHISRAVMEGVGFAMKQCLERVAPNKNDLILSGGVTESEIWCQILADIWDRPIQILSTKVPRACMGTAILAGLGTGIFNSIEEALQLRAESITVLYPKTPENYSRRYEQFLRLYPLLKDEMHLLTMANY